MDILCQLVEMFLNLDTPLNMMLAMVPSFDIPSQYIDENVVNLDFLMELLLMTTYSFNWI